MNKYLVNKIGSRVRVNQTNYIVNLYKLDELKYNSPKLQYDKIEILSWLYKLDDKYINYEEVIKKTKLYLPYRNIKIIPKSINLMLKLTELNLYNNKIVDISGLSSLLKLEYLDLHDNKIVDVICLKSLINLTYLDLSNNKIVDISGLSSLFNLIYLHLPNNKIMDISELSLLKLEYLDLRNNKIEDIYKLKMMLVNTKINI